MSEYIGNVLLPTSPEKDNSAELLIIDSDEVNQEDVDYWRDAGLVFLRDLSKESFHLRFGTRKPDDEEELQEIVDYFVFRSERHHKMLLLMQADRLIGAASVFDYSSLKIPNSSGIVELSVTIADDIQGNGLGAVLLSEAVEAAIADGKEYVYTSFNPENERSRKVVSRVLGTANIIAGRTNPRDKFWRLPGANVRLNGELEQVMKQICGDSDLIITDDTNNVEEILSKRTAKRIARVLHLPIAKAVTEIDK